ncbi:MAG: autotransporter domain-containing protein [Pseudomonas sp.]|uniref:autotransporter family protein n=1 Tax=Pseudomonas sp. TaxID=306 RepID=UPI0027342529|nr:autotransporter outer membrane beta-barrel domain-containing protein [Pseudomonas sp.]MDP3845505.1 autotransporter domain-containing protein [Pseudomonas sp.]
MKASLVSLAVAAAIVAWAPISSAREAVALPGVVGAEGVLNGVDTTGGATLTVTDGQNINTNNDLGGAFTTASSNTGNLLFLGDSTVTGSTGQPGVLFLNISAGATGKAVTFNGDVHATTTQISETGTINFNGDVISAPVFVGDGFLNLGAGRLLTGAITTNTANTGTLTLNSGSNVTGAIGGASGLKQIIVSGGNASITGAVQAQGFSLGANTLSITGALTTNANGTIATTLAGNAVYGNIQPSGSSNINAAGITVIPTVTGVLTPGTTFRIVGGLSGTIGATVTVLNTNPLYTFSSVPTTTGDVLITVESVSLGSPAVDTTAGALIGTPAPAGSDLLAIQGALLALPSAVAVNNALAQLAPSSTNLAAPWVAGQATRLMEDMLLARVDEIQDMCCDANCEPNKIQEVRKCNGEEQQNNLWAKSFGNLGNQNDVNNSVGYDTKTYGLVLGYDRPVSEDTRLGVSAGYANSSIDGNGSSGETTIDSYQLTGYLNYTPGPWYVQGALTAGIDNYEGERQIILPGVSRVAKSDYDGQQYTALVSTGKHFYFDQAVTVTPFASLQTSLIKVDSYTERGAGDVNHRVDDQDYNFTQSGLGVKIERVIQSGASTYSPEAHVKWLHDFSDTTTEQTAVFTGGGSEFNVEGIEQNRDLYNVGAGITFLSCNCDNNSWTVKGQYDYKWNDSEYSSNQLSLIASLKY